MSNQDTYTLVFSKDVVNDFSSTYSYIANDLNSPKSANDLWNKTQTLLEQLENFPYLYPLVKDEFLLSRGYRMIPIKNYLLFYIIKDKKILIVRFLHGTRNWLEILA